MLTQPRKTSLPPGPFNCTYTPKVCRIMAFWAIFRGLGYYFTYFWGPGTVRLGLDLAALKGALGFRVKAYCSGICGDYPGITLRIHPLTLLQPPGGKPFNWLRYLSAH